MNGWREGGRDIDGGLSVQRIEGGGRMDGWREGGREGGTLI